ncbi:MAG: hypothetical protein ACRC5R_04440, partial [Mycoplasmatales bacterium]
DSDSDGVADKDDICNGFDDKIDVDNDGIPDGCDDIIDSDSDGVADKDDICNGFNDNEDSDGDGIPDGCDVCPGLPDDANNNGIPDCEESFNRRFILIKINFTNFVGNFFN